MFELLDEIMAAYQETDHTRLWWRGHADATWRLQPAIYHRELVAEERSMSLRYIELARPLHPSPVISGLFDWLFTMQHHGLPTRLMDWSESPLVALYFCVSDMDRANMDGAIWCLEPMTLNMAEFGEEWLFGQGHPRVVPILNSVLKDSSDESGQRIAALLADRTDLRHAVQHAQCTIHGRDCGIEDCGCSMLKKITIRAAKKQQLRRWLEIFHINRQSLFPDLDNLARYITDNALSRHPAATSD